MMLSTFRYGLDIVFGTLDQMALYRPDLLVVKQKEFFQKKTRLVLTGEMYWGRMFPAPGGASHTVAMHELMEKEHVLHFYDDSIKFEHKWNKGWMEPTLKALMDLTTK